MAYTTINKSTDYFNTKLYTGNGSTQSITGVGFQPDLLWQKSRSNAYGNMWFDAVRGASQRLISNTTSEQSGTVPDSITSFDSDGFSLGADVAVNGNGTTNVAWNWKANGIGSANTDGSINTTYTSANTTAGFSISTYAGTGSSGTIGHGLGVAPKMIIIKRTSGTEDWLVYTTADGSLDYLVLNSTGVAGNSGNAVPTNSVWSVGSNQVQNASGSNYVAYCFAEKTGYSKIGSYTGNGNADGTFIYTGFKPAWVMIKRTDTVHDWRIHDAVRNPSNVIGKGLEANTSDAEYDNVNLDFISNGFKLRTTTGAHNASGASYIYMAFAAAPLVGTNNIPATAR
jgi:hypothetical protein